MLKIISSLFGSFAKSPLSRPAVPVFRYIYKVDLKDYKSNNVFSYPNLDDFFTREINLSTRPISEDFLISPVDGHLRDIRLTGGQDFFIQAKNKTYPLSLILGEKLPPGKNYLYASFYLAPHNYHRIHLPCDCEIVSTKFLGKSRYPVNNFSVNFIDHLFIKNYRSVTQFNWNNGLKGWISAVAALNVSSIEVNVANNVKYKKGDIYGKFHLGSTVVLVLEVPDNLSSMSLREPGSILFGESIWSHKY